MNTFDDLPIIRCRPTPSDAELEAERDQDHARAVREYNGRQGIGWHGVDDDWPVTQVIG